MVVWQVGHDAPQAQQRGSELIVPQQDAEGLAAYLSLFTQIFSIAPVSSIATWTAQLESSTKAQPLWAVFFQLMCHPVPQVSNDLRAFCKLALYKANSYCFCKLETEDCGLAGLRFPAVNPHCSFSRIDLLLSSCYSCIWGEKWKALQSGSHQIPTCRF